MEPTEKNTKKTPAPPAGAGYCFLMDREPTDSELEMIMHSMGERVRAESAALKQKLEEDLSCPGARDS